MRRKKSKEMERREAARLEAERREREAESSSCCLWWRGWGVSKDDARRLLLRPAVTSS